MTVESYQLPFFKPPSLSTIGLSAHLDVVDEALSVPQRHTEPIGHVFQIRIGERDEIFSGDNMLLFDGGRRINQHHVVGTHRREDSAYLIGL